MQITQIRLNDPTGDEPSKPELQLPLPADALISPNDLHTVPVLLLQLQDELTRSRRREALWLSVILHMVVAAALYFSPKFMPARQEVIFATNRDLLSNKELTYLEAPPDRQKVTTPRDTNIISDKNRIAMSRNPKLNHDELRKILDSSRPGTPGPPAATQAPSPQVAQQSPPQPQQGNPQQRGNAPALPATSQAPVLEAEQRGGSGGRNVFANPNTMSAGSMINQAARGAAASRGGGGGGDYGITTPGGGSMRGDMEVLSDTMGVDFGPYLSRVLHDVKQNWYVVIPEIARAPLMKKGQVSIEFAITKNGKVAGLRLVGGSGDVSLDRAAWSGITASDPFPPLPSEYRGDYLALRFHFLYNPDKNDMR